MSFASKLQELSFSSASTTFMVEISEISLSSLMNHRRGWLYLAEENSSLSQSVRIAMMESAAHSVFPPWTSTKYMSILTLKYYVESKVWMRWLDMSFGFFFLEGRRWYHLRDMRREMIWVWVLFLGEGKIWEESFHFIYCVFFKGEITFCPGLSEKYFFYLWLKIYVLR